MHKTSFLRISAALSLFLLAACQQGAIKDAINIQLSQYPESRVTDIYKNFCQDNLGAGHLIMHHSEEFSEAYNPHYRIVARDIFENELLKSL